MKCPECGCKVVYQGLQFEIECEKYGCKNGPVIKALSFKDLEQELALEQCALQWYP
jgi:hypothetical protein